MIDVLSKIKGLEIGEDNFKKTFLLLFVLYALCMLPIAVAFYPVLASSDFFLQVEDFLSGTYHVDISGLRGSDTSVEAGLSAHNPVAVTLLYGSLAFVGRSLSGNAEIGLFLCQLFNLIAAASAFSFITCKMFRIFDNRAVIAAIAAVIVFPFAMIQAMQCGKDSLFGISFAVWFALLLEMAVLHGSPLETPKGFAALTVFSILCILTRNTGIFIVIPSLLVAGIVFKGKMKYALGSIGVCVLIGVLPINLAVVGGLVIRDDVFQEAFGNMFQQTAAYSLAYPDEQSDEEKDAINRILVYDDFAEYYDADLSDGIKFGTFRKSEPITAADKWNYIQVYAGEGMRHPEIYASALFELLQPYVVPGYATGYDILFFVMDDEIRDYLENEQGMTLSEEVSANGDVIAGIQSPEIIAWMFEHGKAPTFRMNSDYYTVLSDYMQTNTDTPLKRFYQILPYSICSAPVAGVVFSRAAFALFMPLLIMLFSVLTRRKAIAYLVPIALLMLSLLFCPYAPARYIAPLIIIGQFFLIPMAVDALRALRSPADRRSH